MEHTLDNILPAEQNFLLFEDKLAGSMPQQTKETIVPRGKFSLVENCDQLFWCFPLFTNWSSNKEKFCLVQWIPLSNQAGVGQNPPSGWVFPLLCWNGKQ